MRRDVGQPARQDNADITSVCFLREDGTQIGLADWRGTPVLLVFLRWLG